MTFSGLRYHINKWKKYYNTENVLFTLYEESTKQLHLNNKKYFYLLQYDNPEKNFEIVRVDYWNDTIFVELKMDVRC